MRFNSSRNKYTVGLLWLTVLFLLLTPFLPEEENEITFIVSILISYLIAALLIWILLDTKYSIKENQLEYYSGPIRGKIDIKSISKIEHVTTWYVGSVLKPALGYKGLTVHYNKFDDIYISPQEKEKFLGELLRINPEIKIA